VNRQARCFAFEWTIFSSRRMVDEALEALAAKFEQGFQSRCAMASSGFEEQSQSKRDTKFSIQEGRYSVRLVFELLPSVRHSDMLQAFGDLTSLLLLSLKCESCRVTKATRQERRALVGAIEIEEVRSLAGALARAKAE
jgi:hypothetical protein